MLIAARSGLAQQMWASGLNVLVNQDSHPPGQGRPQDEVWVAINPSNLTNWAASANDYRNTQISNPTISAPGFYASADGGNTWPAANQGVVPFPPVYGTALTFGGDTCVRFDQNSTAFLGYVLYSQNAVSAIDFSDLFLAKSQGAPAGGAYPPVTGQPLNHYRIAVSFRPMMGPFDFVDKPLHDIFRPPNQPAADRVHVAFSHILPGGFPLVGDAERRVFCQTVTWPPGQPAPGFPCPGSAPNLLTPQFPLPGTSVPGGVRVSDATPLVGPWPAPTNFPRNIGATVAAALDGTVYVAWLSFPPTMGDFRGRIMIDRSLAGGCVWNSLPAPAAGSDFMIRDIPNRLEGVPLVTPQGGRLAAGSLPSIAVHPANANIVVVSWSEFVGGQNVNADIWFALSTNGGSAWTTASLPRPEDQWSPSCTIDSNGIIYISYYDRRDDPNNQLMHAGYSYSLDLGVTWIDHRISRWPSNPRYARVRNPGEQFMGDYNGANCRSEAPAGDLLSQTRLAVSWTDNQRIAIQAPLASIDTDVYVAPIAPTSLILGSQTVVAGTPVNLFLDAGVGNAGKTYQLAASSTGTWPGITYEAAQPTMPGGAWGVVLPLTNGSGSGDPYFTLSVIGAPPIFTNFAGVLSALGTATATFLPPLPLAGTTVTFAYLLIEPATWRFASNAVLLRIL